MKHYGLTIAEGSEITNATVATGTVFPGNESAGELFFRTDTSTLYVWDGSEWDKSSTTEVVDDMSPELGGDLGVGGFDIEASSGGSYLRLNDTTTYLQGKYSTGGIGTNLTLNAGGSNLVGGGLNLWAGDADAVGGTINMTAGDGGTGAAGDVQINGGGSTDGIGGEVKITSGGSTNSTSGDIQFIIGTGSTAGSLIIQNVGGSGDVVPLKFQESGVNNDYVALQAPTAVATSRTWTLPQSDPTTSVGKYLTTNTAGEWSFDTVATSPAGSTTQIQYNNGGVLAADDDLTWNSGGRFLYVGNTGTGYITTGNGNKLSIRAGSSATTTGGELELKAGTGASTSNGGNMVFTAGKGGSTSGDGGSLILNSGGASEGDGGELQINATDGTGTNQQGGAVNINGGDSTGTQIGGNVGIIAGDGGATGTGGVVQLLSGGGGGDTIEGSSLVLGGRTSAGYGGTGTLSAGYASSVNGHGGGLQFVGGAADGTGTGGSLIFSAGSTGAGGAGGDLQLTVGGSSGAGATQGIARLTVNGTPAQNTPPEFRFYEADPSGSYIAFKAPDSPSADRTWVLPDDDPATASGKYLTTDASGNWSFDTPAGGGGTPGGSDRQVQFNDSTSFGGDSGLVYESDGTLNVAGTADYEDLVTSDDDIPNKKYVDDIVASGGTFAARMTIYEYTATAGQTTFTGADDNGETLTYNEGEVIVFQNGTMLDPDDYTATSGTSIVLNTGAPVGHEVNIIRYAMETFSAAQPILYEYTATAGQTTFSGADDNAVVLGYTAGELLVFKNGILLDPSDYTATSGTSIVLDTGAVLDDEVNILRFIAVERFNTLKTYRYLLDTGDDTASGTDAKGNTLGYAINLLNVYLNGSKLSEDQYTATDGSSVVLDDAMDSDNNILEITTYSTFTSVDEVTARANLIINSNFNIWQRDTSFTVSSGSYVADRWALSCNGAMVIGVDRTVPSPSLPGSDYVCGVSVDTADASLAAGDYTIFTQVIEGYQLQSSKIGTSEAETATLSFRVKASLTGTYCVAFRSQANARSYVAEYTIDTADVWERKEITLPLDTSGTWFLGSGVGMYVTWTLASGTTYHASAAETWASENDIATSNQVNAVASTSNTFELGQVRFEIGPNASAYRDRHFEQEMALCQRYYQKSYDLDDLPGDITNAGVWSTRTNNAGNVTIDIPFPVRMRSTPTMTGYNSITGGTSTPLRVQSSNYAVTLDFIGEGSSSGYNNSAAGAGQRAYMHWTADAEL